ncbi:MAG: outer membrane protein transport protein [Deltaproteobacteria bacterium]|nr:outer membrane protein transport protein [Deltaproteobacteria bacterium]
MKKWQRSSANWAVLLVLALLVPATAYGAAFGIFEQGSKGMGMAGAFTAQADDPSLLFHNAGGLAFVEKQQITTGFTWIHVNGSEFTGASPFPGDGVREDLKDLDAFPPHLYWVRPINQTWKFGIGLTSPFGLATEWENPSTFTGRFISQRAELQVVDLNPTIGVLLTQNFGIGVGLIGRFTTVELERAVPSINPFTGGVADIAAVDLESDMDSGFGWNAGILHKVGSAFSWGLSYRSKVEVDYSGDGHFTQILTGIPQFDAVVAGLLPFGSTVPITTTIEFPDMASLGFAFNLTEKLLTEVDINWTGWSSFDQLPLTFVGFPGLSSIIPQDYEDANNYRLGFNYSTGSGSEWRFGVGFDESPQPEEGVGPLLPDSDRTVFTLGYGTAGGKVDLALMYLDSDDRTTTNNLDGFFGTYQTSAVLFGATYNW